MQRAVYDIDESSLYDKRKYIQHYKAHNDRVIDYFKYRKEGLLILNLADLHAMKNLCDFLDMPDVTEIMPHLNKSRP